MTLTNSSIAVAFILSAASAPAANLLVNGDFESAYTGRPGAPGNGNSTIVPGWRTTASTGLIEVWGSGFRGINSANGTTTATVGGSYFAEINAESVAVLYQDVTITTVGLIDYTFLHRGRGYNDPSDPGSTERRSDVMSFSITNLGADNVWQATDTVIFTRTVTTDNLSDPGEYNGWVNYTGDDVFTSVSGQGYRFSYAAISTGAGSNTIGNFLDAAGFGVGVAVPEPSSTLLLGIAGLGLVCRRKRA